MKPLGIVDSKADSDLAYLRVNQVLSVIGLRDHLNVSTESNEGSRTATKLKLSIAGPKSKDSGLAV